MSLYLRALIITLSFPLFLQASNKAKSDSIDNKSGMKYGILPSIAYDSDLGLQYGGLVNFFWYGDGKTYPVYHHSLYLEASQYTSGTGLARVYYDSPNLIKGIRTTADFTYFNDLANDFYGFNGYRAVLNPHWEDQNHPEYKTRVFYSHYRQMTRVMTNFKGKISKNYPNLKWMAGFTLFNMNIGSTKIDKLNKRISDDKLLPDTAGLYDLYSEWGLIKPSEINGGTNTYVKLGLSYDNRDFEANPGKGMWTEVFLSISPGFLSTNSSYAQISAIHRQYFSLKKNKLIFAYRLGVQSKISGDIPFYLLPHLLSSNLTSATSQGLGGSKTLRGIRRNRIVGEGVFLSNLELRWKIFEAKLFKQDFYMANNTFIDFGRVIKQYDVDYSLIPEEDRISYVRDESEKMHVSFGTGLKFALNENFILSVDYGHATSNDDGTSGVYILLNYLF
ncbi:hypothetical protein E9993_22160 [Labilibacter sediminis]|nr:hypothetical protein E9993_22160 [Labilibacter sediminis]